ncbi:MAG: heavy-metal-associated domain-containing protein [Aquabacterium sp.]|uniref:heavy-metal-associated domain-containing protein n=1 Tax=Aquabacterium sp. TaxID=1872578 RepID=UPI0025EDD017|nr:heavy-metal-associated domain-containing protein [uncultured Aquabacterium sp.]
MLAYRVDDMTCGHCAATITKAIQALDSQARVEIDLAQHRVQVETAQADAEAVRAAIEDAGYTPVAA